MVAAGECLVVDCGALGDEGLDGLERCAARGELGAASGDLGLLAFMPGAGLCGALAGAGEPGREGFDQIVASGWVGCELGLARYGVFGGAGFFGP